MVPLPSRIQRIFHQSSVTTLGRHWRLTRRRGPLPVSCFRSVQFCLWRLIAKSSVPSLASLLQDCRAAAYIVSSDQSRSRNRQIEMMVSALDVTRTKYHLFPVGYRIYLLSPITIPFAFNRILLSAPSPCDNHKSYPATRFTPCNLGSPSSGSHDDFLVIPADLVSFQAGYSRWGHLFFSLFPASSISNQIEKNVMVIANALFLVPVPRTFLKSSFCFQFFA